MTPLVDSLGRRIKDLRISVTDRCNFYCSYCRDETTPKLRARRDILSFEEIERLARVLAAHGIEKIRLTGGEPLLRRQLDTLIARLVAIPGILDIAMTTNGFILEEHAARLRAAGLKRINLSVDSTRRERFDRTVGVASFHRVMNGLDAALAAGFERVKLNAVLVRGDNDDEILEFLELGRRTGVEIRFIEFMPLEEGDRWRRDLVVTAAEILRAVESKHRVVPLQVEDPSQTAREYRVEELGTTFGIIASVSTPFCGQCSRIRITSDGHLRTCLFSTAESDLKPLLREERTDAEIADAIASAVKLKEPGHRINEPDFVKPKRRMVLIGG